MGRFLEYWSTKQKTMQTTISIKFKSKVLINELWTLLTLWHALFLHCTPEYLLSRKLACTILCKHKYLKFKCTKIWFWVHFNKQDLGNSFLWETLRVCRKSFFFLFSVPRAKIDETLFYKIDSSELSNSSNSKKICYKCKLKRWIHN
jgi:hypothetical protein